MPMKRRRGRKTSKPGWNSRVCAPTRIIGYIGINKGLKKYTLPSGGDQAETHAPPEVQDQHETVLLERLERIS